MFGRINFRTKKCARQKMFPSENFRINLFREIEEKRQNYKAYRQEARFKNITGQQPKDIIFLQRFQSNFKHYATNRDDNCHKYFTMFILFAPGSSI